ncbi:MAG: hypothetical protein QOH49_4787 [Acidobacteriota bacterium]|jgi:hypothetical protein|nr:hypothetical protein [Acidobacteriota bacterium]
MFVGRRRLTFSLLLAASLLLSPLVSAQTAANDWSALKAVATGSKVEVKLKDGKTVKGKLTGVLDDALSLSVGGKPTDLKAGDVSRVYRVGGSSAGKAALIGAAVGAGAGAAVGASGGDEGFGPSNGVFAAGFAVLGGGAGALIGYAVGRGKHKRVLIYEVAQP